ncbi:hypothetical protein [Victivallis sp. Marseille-Q1083]|uniref:EamA family transporter n=1 Tax=Victivallis sp. Marseille-Q1083 TaxID=2717288 RepID=UPI001589568F|nr:hypothetical protein [Victivallis sp. Marseille-Q1083]
MIFGMIALTLVGLSWTVVGIVMGQAPRRQIDPGLILFCGAAVAIFASLAILTFTKTDAVGGMAEMLTCLAYLAGGVLNYWLLHLMSRAMQLGPNGVVWTMVQSAMIFPFLTGIVFFGEKLTVCRAAGLGLILVALVLFGLAKDNTVNRTGRWRLLAFAAFLLAGIQQNCTTLPSYFPAARTVSSLVRLGAAGTGTFVAALAGLLYGMNRERYREILGMMRMKALWIYVFSLQFFSLVFAATLFYPGMDALARAGAGAVSVPLLVGSCIIGFALYSILILREKTSVLQVVAVICCLAGIVGICCNSI